MPPITDPEAVRAAIAEYRSLGAEAFLAKYGYGVAKSYRVEYEGHLYDSKAIAAAAYSHQFPGKRWTNDQFSGGIPVVGLLGRLGFTVTRSPSSAGETSVVVVQLERNMTREFIPQPATDVVAQRREAQLVGKFADHLRSMGRAPARHRIRVIESGSRLETDLFDEDASILYEAKSSVDRSTIRLGLGQILDYRRFMNDVEHYRLLLPERPIAELVGLLALYDVGITWADGDEWRDESASAYQPADDLDGDRSE
jgi:hypothetical protein